MIRRAEIIARLEQRLSELREVHFMLHADNFDLMQQNIHEVSISPITTAMADIDRAVVELRNKTGSD